MLAVPRCLSGANPTTGHLQNRYLYAPGIDELLTDGAK